MVNRVDTVLSISMNSTCCDQRIEYVKYLMPDISQDILPTTSQDILQTTSQDILQTTSQDILPTASQDILQATSQDILRSSIISGLQAIIYSSLLYLSVGIMDSLHSYRHLCVGELQNCWSSLKIRGG
jgi:hypothetical protein